MTISSDVIFEELTHKYTIHGIPLISVTQILKRLEDSFKGVNPEVLRIAGEKGTNIHTFCEKYALSNGSLEINCFEDDFPDYKTQFTHFWKEFNPQKVYTEVITSYSLEYAGMVDLVSKRGNQWYIIDYKTSSNVQQAYKWGLQMALYQRALEDMAVNLGSRLPVRRLVLHLTPKGYKLLDLTDNLFLYVVDEIILSLLNDSFDKDIDYLRGLILSVKKIHKNKYVSLTKDALIV